MSGGVGENERMNATEHTMPRWRLFLRKWAFPLCALALLAFILFREPPVRSGFLDRGTQIPDALVLDLTTGKKVALSTIQQERPAAIHVFTSWCRVCKQGWPRIPKLNHKYGDEMALILLGFDVGSVDSYLAVQRFALRNPVGLPVYVGGPDLLRALRPPEYPYTVFISPERRVLYDPSGMLSHRAFRIALTRNREQQRSNSE
ncbi:MAG: hypothetical protein CMH54_11325 [Myxococcales bacterium]|nr:hypothetical protein [Myxococcales bacterium]